VAAALLRAVGIKLIANAGAFTTLRTHQHEIGNIQGSVEFNDTGRLTDRSGPPMPLSKVDALDDHSAGRRHDALNTSTSAAITSGHNLNGVALANAEASLRRHG
jgi:hypothetical protein